MLQDNYLDQPWECEGLDPFRDYPIATESGFEYDDIEEAKSDEEIGEVGDEATPCTCGNCVHMPSSYLIFVTGTTGGACVNKFCPV